VRDRLRALFALRAGKLLKKSPNLFGGWQMRWFYLFQGTFSYYKSGEINPQSHLDLENVRGIYPIQPNMPGDKYGISADDMKSNSSMYCTPGSGAASGAASANIFLGGSKSAAAGSSAGSEDPKSTEEELKSKLAAQRRENAFLSLSVSQLPAALSRFIDPDLGRVLDMVFAGEPLAKIHEALLELDGKSIDDDPSKYAFLLSLVRE
jgi:hypothetical protein